MSEPSSYLTFRYLIYETDPSLASSDQPDLLCLALTQTDGEVVH